MKILLAAGVFYPDVGGPSVHVRQIAERLSTEGFQVQVVAYGDDPTTNTFPFKVTRVSRHQPKVLQWLCYSWLVFWHSLNAKLLYGFDLTAAGTPPALMAFLLRKPYILRIGGDPIWERQAELGRRLMPIERYYEQGLYKKDNYPLYLWIKLFIKVPSVIVVYNQNFANFYRRYFGVPREKIRIIKNPAFRRELGSPILPEEPIILFAGRFVAYKNLDRVIRVVKNLPKGKLLLIGSGPEKEKLISEGVPVLNSLPQEKLFEEIKKSAICIGPALSEFNPNFILEALSLGKPVLLSRGHGLSVELPEEFLFNPEDDGELREKLKALLEGQAYARAVGIVNNLPLNISWEEVTGEHLAIIKRWTRKG